MFRRIADFKNAWGREREATLKILGAVTDASLAQAVSKDDRTLGRIAWHLTQTIGEMMSRTGLAVTGPGRDAPVPSSAAAVLAAYEKASQAIGEEIESGWTDATLEVEDDMYGQKWPRGATLMALIVHQTHHRGQMTVLMRQAGLVVPGTYGPAREEWAAHGMGAPAV
jgi:uncharacterized damage-inducible protein DinB